MKNWLNSHQHLLAQQLQQSTLPHAILVSGVAGAGKQALASWLVALLVCQRPEYKADILSACGQCKSCLLKASETYPDHLTLVSETKSLGVDDVRFANQFLQKKSHFGHYKTVLIPFAERMTLAAANALLKTLEEPNANSVLILLTEDVDRLLPTIISRCRVLTLRPAVGKNLLDSLGQSQQHGLSDSFINLTHLPELADESINRDYHQFEQLVLSFLHGRNTAVKSDIQKNEQALLASLLGNEHALRWLEKIVVNLQRSTLMNLANRKSTIESHIEVNSELNSELLHQVYKIILASSKVLKSYVQANNQFVMEQLLMDISHLLVNIKE